jgi:hypothetical protein
MHLSLENMSRLDKEALLVGGWTPGRIGSFVGSRSSNLVLCSDVRDSEALDPSESGQGP